LVYYTESSSSARRWKGGSIITSNQDGTLEVGNIEVAVDGALLSCPEHGVVSVSAITTKSFHNKKLILTHGAVAACGATIISPDRKVYVERRINGYG